MNRFSHENERLRSGNLSRVHMCGGSTHLKETSNGRYGNENIVTVFHWTPTPARFPHKVGSEVRLTIIAERALAWKLEHFEKINGNHLLSRDSFRFLVH